MHCFCFGVQDTLWLATSVAILIAYERNREHMSTLCYVTFSGFFRECLRCWEPANTSPLRELVICQCNSFR